MNEQQYEEEDSVAGFAGIAKGINKSIAEGFKSGRKATPEEAARIRAKVAAMGGAAGIRAKVAEIRARKDADGGGEGDDAPAQSGGFGGDKMKAALKRIKERREAEAKANVQAVKRGMFRHRIDYRWLPDKRIEAVLTVTLPDGHVFRFTANADPHEIATALAKEHPEVGGFSLGGLWKGIKKVAKGVATSKVFKLAGTALAMAAPALGPLAPMALGASAAMKASTALLAAKTHAAKGTPKGKADAATLIKYAANAVKVVDKTNVKLPTKKPGARALPPSAALLDSANKTSQTLYTMLLKPA